MPLTKDLKDTIKSRAECDSEFRAGLFGEAIEAVWPQATVQTCVVHLIRCCIQTLARCPRRRAIATVDPDGL